MAHFAEIDENNVVVRVVVVPDEQESRGEEYLAQDLGLGGNWLKTSYNTYAGVHTNGGTPFRLNFASVGDIYDPQLDGFIKKSPFDSWVKFDPATGLRIPPVAKPEDAPDFSYYHEWDESNLTWVKVINPSFGK